MDKAPKFPWRLDTNDRYREVVKQVTTLSTAALLLPVFLARNFLGVKPEVPLKSVFSSGVYWGWGFFSLSILAGLVFHFFSAKWVRMAWGQPASVLGHLASEKVLEKGLEISFWACTLFFFGGLFLTVWFFLNYTSKA